MGTPIILPSYSASPVCLCLFIRKNMYAGGDNTQMNGDTPHDGGHGGGGHAIGEELKKTGR